MLKIIVDTREQNPLTWENELKPYDVVLTRDKLDFGDYSLVGHDQPSDDDSIVIERKKNCQELVGNLGTNWDRFKDEMAGLKAYKHKSIIVCGPNNFAHLYNQGFTKLHPNFIYKRLADLFIYYNISTVFLNTREDAENYIYRLFNEIANKTRNEN